MDLTRRFLAAARPGATCGDALALCVPGLEALAASVDAAELYAAGIDVLGAACGAAAIVGASRVKALELDRPAWGVAAVHGRDTLCLWDGRTVWAQGARGATILPKRYVKIAWSI